MFSDSLSKAFTKGGFTTKLQRGTPLVRKAGLVALGSSFLPRGTVREKRIVSFEVLGLPDDIPRTNGRDIT